MADELLSVFIGADLRGQAGERVGPSICAGIGDLAALLTSQPSARARCGLPQDDADQFIRRSHGDPRRADVDLTPAAHDSWGMMSSTSDFPAQAG
jgi:hypothetical protein